MPADPTTLRTEAARIGGGVGVTLSQAADRIEALEAERDEARAECGKRNAQLTAARERIAGLERQIAASVMAVGREAYRLGYNAGHDDTVEGCATLAPGERWDEDEQLQEDAGATKEAARVARLTRELATAPRGIGDGANPTGLCLACGGDGILGGRQCPDCGGAGWVRIPGRKS